MYALEIGAAPDELSFVSAGLLQKNRQSATDACRVEVALLVRQKQL
jgi:hypothetical protein